MSVRAREKAMDYSDFIILILELVGTVAFACSGAMLGVKRKMDIFGVNVLGVTTAVGGGLIRDLILGIIPPAMFRHSIYAMTAIVSSTLLFLAVYVRRQIFTGSVAAWYDRIMFYCDSVGLGIFTVVGCQAAIFAGYSYNRFLTVFVGVLTGVGGGLIRDVMASELPYIFVKHVYAVASLAGALLCVFLYPYAGRLISMVIGAGAVILIRFLAAHYRWNLPRIQ